MAGCRAYAQAALLLWFAAAASVWLGCCGEEALSDGTALESFFNSTWPGESGFESNKTCSWNKTRVQCNSAQTAVTALLMPHLGLSGPIPNRTISNLRSLEKLDLSANSLSGAVPDLSSLSNLALVRLGRNNFSSISGLSPALTELDLSHNLLTAVPDLFQLSNLADAKLGGNNFSSAPTKFPPTLTELDLSANSLAGAIPEALFNLSSLVSLNLSFNHFDRNLSSIPASLQFLDLSYNRLSGEIRGLAPNLTYFDVRGNHLTGNVTEFIGNLSSRLKVLDLSSNNFSLQAVPSNFTRFSDLSTLGLADNRFLDHGFPTLPLHALVTLNLSHVNLSGSIPDWIVNLSTLVHLDLSDNHLTESIPTDLGALGALTTVDLSRNDLSGAIPRQLSNLTSLRYFNVSDNNLTGEIPLTSEFLNFNASSFQGNPGLCGYPLPTRCSNGSSAVNGTSSSTSSGKGKSNAVAIIVGLVLGCIVILLCCAAVLVWCRVSGAVKPLRVEPRHVSGPMQYEKDTETWATGVKDASNIQVVMFERPLLNLTFADLLQASGNFGKEMQIADGGHGPVFKGVLPDTTQLAIKVLVDVRFFDEEKAASEIEALGRVKHPNLVPLIGYCVVGDDNVLIYDYMVNGDLQRWLYELPEGNRNPEDWSLDTWEHPEGAEAGGEYLSWPTRHKIALGTARGLAFLHHGCSPQIVHGDVKSSTVLLDENFGPHLMDCGLAGISRTKGTPINGGTCGYVPPEYDQIWQTTTKGDVYSFGVVLLELVTGRKPIGRFLNDSYGGNLVGWVRFTMRLDKRGQKALDQKLVSRGHVPEMLETLRIGYLCTAESPAKRPTMQQVVGLLKDCESAAVS